MAKRRMISASLGSSRKFAEVGRRSPTLGEFAQCLYVLLVTHTDDFGRQPGDAFTVKHAVWPTSARTESDFGMALSLLAEAGLVEVYPVNGADVLQILDFERHQSGLHKRTESRFPSGVATPGAKLAYSGQRFKVWTWQHEDFVRALGSKPFDLLAWYPKLDAEMVKSGEPIADEKTWLTHRLYAAAGIARPNLFRGPELVQSVPDADASAKRRAALRAGQ